MGVVDELVHVSAGRADPRRIRGKLSRTPAARLLGGELFSELIRYVAEGRGVAHARDALCRRMFKLG
jgi:hypothetical protein